ncbi:MAG TPA: hypothetical protein V6C58_22750 [Allocoleopsis sp.]
MYEKDNLGKMIAGIFLVIPLHIAAITITATLTGVLQSIIPGSYPILIMAMFGIGIFQFLYVIPTLIILYNKEEWGLMKGVIIGAIITFLLNGGCWLLLLSAYQR